MLEFYLDIENDISSDQMIEGLEMEEVSWLSKMNIIKKGSTGLLENDGPEALPYYDDFKLTYDQVHSMFDKFKKKKEEMLSTPGFKNRTLEKYEKILGTAIQYKCGLKAFCD